jgi:hypothetical protein
MSYRQEETILKSATPALAPEESDFIPLPA